MSSMESRIFDLIEQWEASREKGHALTPEQLCADCPELIPDVARRIKALNATAWMEKPVAPVSSEPQPQQKTVGRYELIEPIGKGGFADVWSAYDPELNRFVAIKIPKSSSSTFHTENFLEEGRKAARLRHPGIVSVLDVGRKNNQWFIVSELFEGGSLAERIKTKLPSHHESIRLVSQIAEALFHAHQQGFIHRDVKPQNILIDEYGNPKITDFGIALSETQTVAERSRSAGTLAYMSPEQASILPKLMDLLELDSKVIEKRTAQDTNLRRAWLGFCGGHQLPMIIVGRTTISSTHEVPIQIVRKGMCEVETYAKDFARCRNKTVELFVRNHIRFVISPSGEMDINELGYLEPWLESMVEL